MTARVGCAAVKHTLWDLMTTENVSRTETNAPSNPK